MHPLILATRNPHKVKEVRRILRSSRIRVRPLSDFPPLPEVVENGRTLEANARKKAVAVLRALHAPAVADDSGLFVPALEGKPGVRSARYAGPVCDYAANNRKLLRALGPRRGRERRAYFATAVALARPGKPVVIRIGKVWGRIIREARGRNGFGYDPIFIPRGETLTFAQMSAARKNRISHRARAFQKLADYLASNRIER